MIEQLTMTTKIDGELCTADVYFVFYGLTSIQIDEVYVGDELIEELSFSEQLTIQSKIVAAKLGHMKEAV